MDPKDSAEESLLTVTESPPLSEEVLSQSGQSQVHRNPELPPEITGFKQQGIAGRNLRLTADEWISALHGTEIRDKLQQIKLRPWFAAGVFVLVAIQNMGIWFIVVWALNLHELAGLQLIFATLIAGTLTQSYFILKFITNKVFSDIDYHNPDARNV